MSDDGAVIIRLLTSNWTVVKSTDSDSILIVGVSVSSIRLIYSRCLDQRGGLDLGHGVTNGMSHHHHITFICSTKYKKRITIIMLVLS